MTVVNSGPPAPGPDQAHGGWLSSGLGHTAPTPVRLLLLHLALGPAVALSPMVSGAHALAVVTAAVLVIARHRGLEVVVLAAAYVAASDVLWRSTEARVPYEGAKYLAGGLMFVAVFRFVRSPVLAVLPLAYLGVLLPSAVLTMDALGITGAREALSFNLSGPFMLAASALLFLQVRLTWADFERVVFAMLLPLATLLAAVTFQTARTSDLTFGSESNYDTSGSFGPNQVSTVLCLGALFCLILVLRRRDIASHVMLAALGLWFFGQGALTFSRGGLFNVVISGSALLIAMLFVSRDRVRIIILVAMMIGGAVLVFSWLDDFTGGALEDRFSEIDSTGRDELAAGDLRLFREHPFSGVGPGLSGSRREGSFYGVVAHTEFTRLLSEHGSLGVVAIIAMGAMSLVALARAPSRWARAVSLCLIAWSLSSMTNAAMRTGAVGFVFGLGLARIGAPEREERSR